MMKANCFFYKWGFFVNAFGKCFSVEYKPEYVPMFSERNGYRHYRKFAGFVIKFNPSL